MPGAEVEGNFLFSGQTASLWRKPATGALAYWLMNGDAILSSGIISTITLDWQVEN